MIRLIYNLLWPIGLLLFLPSSWTAPIAAKVASCLSGWNPLFVETAIEHGIGLTHEDMRRHLVFCTAELPQRREQDQVVKRLGGQCQTERPRV